MRATVIIELNSCRNNCLFCNPLWSKREVSAQEWRDIEAHALGQAVNLKNQGIDELEISGCDPIEYPRIADFVRLLKGRLKFRCVQIATHGRELSSVAFVRRLAAAGLDELKIPVYGSTALIHDAVTQQGGSFRETLQGIRNVLRYAKGTKVAISSLIMKQNCRDLTGILRVALRYSSDICFSLPCVSNLENGLSFAPDLNKIRTYVMALLKLGKRSGASLVLRDVPYCVIGEVLDNVVNSSGGPLTADTYSIPKAYRSDTPYVPAYRVKKHLPCCDACRARGKCGGFFDRYIRLFDFSRIRPL